MWYPFSRQLRSDHAGVELAYPVHAAALVVVVIAAALGLDDLALGGLPLLQPIGPLVLRAGVALMAVLVMWLVWWATVRFDQARDRVRAGLVTIGRVSDIQSIEWVPDGVEVVFSDGWGLQRRWPLRGIQPRDRAALGARLASLLHVPFR